MRSEKEFSWKRAARSLLGGVAVLAVLAGCTAGEGMNATGTPSAPPNPPTSPPPPSDTTPPTISNVTVSNIGQTSVTVSWNTNEAASTRVEYGASPTYGSVVTGAANVSSHSVVLSNLAAGTLYHYRVVSADAANNEAVSTDATFTTAASPISYTLIVIKNGSGSVSSAPTGIICGTSCSASFPANTQVTLIAAPNTGYEFAGWSSPCTGNANTCSVDMTQNREVSANFRQTGIVDLNCGGTWAGNEETNRITAWPYRDCFRTNPVGTRTRMTNNAGAEVVWDVGAGWNGQNALRVRPPNGSLGRLQGYAGLGEHHFHAVRTKRLNIRYLFRYNANWVRYAQNTKWDIAIKYDYTNPTAPVRREGCERGIVETRGDPLDTNPRDGQDEDFVIKQGVCNQGWTIPNRSGWKMAPGVRENEWISVENEFDLDTGWYRTYITTQDGVFNHTVHTQINISTNTYGAPSETVPNPYWWGTIDCSTGCFWGWPDDGGSYPRPADTYIWFSHFVMSNSYIGPPAGFVQ
jgi:hypothetical protein